MKHTARFLILSALLASAAPATMMAAPGYHLVRKVPLPGEGGWDYLTLDASAHRLYIARSTHVTVVDVGAGKVVGDIPDLAGVHGVALDPKSGRGFTSNGRANTVTIFDLKTLGKIAEVPVGEGPDAILFEPVTRRVFTFNGRAGTATVLDAATGKVIGTVALPGRPESAVADGRSRLYDNIEDKGAVVAIDARTLKVENTWPLAPGEGPSGIAMDRKSRRLFSVGDNGKLIVLDADDGHVVAAPAIGNGPDACVFDPTSHLVFSPNGEDGTLTILRELSPNRYETVATVTTQPGARTMALDEKTHHVFTVAATPLPAAPGGSPPRRRSYAPGSFVVLEYAP